MIDLNKVKRFNEKDKTVLIRFDLNVPLGSKELHKSERVVRIKKSISKLISLNSKIVILSHVGRPYGEAINELSLKQLVEPLKKALNKDIVFISDCIGVEVKNKISETNAGKIILLENCRFYNDEEANNDDFAKSLSHLADVYINDAFACSHRAHASTEGVTKFLSPKMLTPASRPGRFPGSRYATSRPKTSRRAFSVSSYWSPTNATCRSRNAISVPATSLFSTFIRTPD